MHREGNHPAMTARYCEAWVDCHERRGTAHFRATRGSGRSVGIGRCTGMIVMLIGRGMFMRVMGPRGVCHVAYLGSVMVVDCRQSRKRCERLPR